MHDCKSYTEEKKQRSRFTNRKILLSIKTILWLDIFLRD